MKPTSKKSFSKSLETPNKENGYHVTKGLAKLVVFFFPNYGEESVVVEQYLNNFAKHKISTNIVLNFETKTLRYRR